MKNKNVTLNTQITCPTKKIKELETDIYLLRKNMKLLIAFAVGEKTLSRKHERMNIAERTEVEDKRLLTSLKLLRQQISELKNEISGLKEKAYE